MQVLPSAELLPFIKHYIFLESTETEVARFRLFSDGNTGMVFSSNNTLASNPKNAETIDYLPQSFLYGQVSTFREIYLPNKTSLIIVVFQPYGINKLTGIPANELSNKIIGLENISSSRTTALLEKLFRQQDLHHKLQLLNNFFVQLIPANLFRKQLLVEESVNYILRKRGLVTVSELVKFTGYTERHIERKFMECIGLNPKKIGNIIKFNGFLKQLNNKPAYENITALVYEAGYADQSHLIKDFKKYTGITPTVYVNEVEKPTVNFVRLPEPQKA